MRKKLLDRRFDVVHLLKINEEWYISFVFMSGNIKYVQYKSFCSLSLFESSMYVLRTLVIVSA